MAVLGDTTTAGDEPMREDGSSPTVILDGVTRVFRGRGDRDAVTAVNNVTVSLPAGQTVALTGPAGSGKSTVLNVIAGIERPDTGTVIVGGVRPAELSARRAAAFRRRIGFVSGDAELVAALTVLDNVVFPLLLERSAELPRRADRQQRALTLVDAVGLGSYANAPLARLSGAQRRLVVVARAMVNWPALVLADEPASSLDRDAAAVLDVLLRLVRQQGSTLVLATRDDTVAVRCRRVIGLRKGTVVADHLDDTAPEAVRRWVNRSAPLG